MLQLQVDRRRTVVLCTKENLPDGSHPFVSKKVILCFKIHHLKGENLDSVAFSRAKLSLVAKKIVEGSQVHFPF